MSFVKDIGQSEYILEDGRRSQDKLTIFDGHTVVNDTEYPLLVYAYRAGVYYKNIIVLPHEAITYYRGELGSAIPTWATFGFQLMTLGAFVVLDPKYLNNNGMTNAEAASHLITFGVTAVVTIVVGAITAGVGFAIGVEGVAAGIVGLEAAGGSLGLLVSVIGVVADISQLIPLATLMDICPTLSILIGSALTGGVCGFVTKSILHENFEEQVSKHRKENMEMVEKELKSTLSGNYAKCKIRGVNPARTYRIYAFTAGPRVEKVNFTNDGKIEKIEWRKDEIQWKEIDEVEIRKICKKVNSNDGTNRFVELMKETEAKTQCMKANAQ